MSRVDSNLFYNVKRAGLIGPQQRAGQVILDLQAKEQLPRSAPGGLGDQNLFFRIKARITPNFQKRIIKDLDPLTRVIGQIPITLKERQAAGVLSSLELISGVLANFLSTPELNPDGTPKINPATGLPIIKLRNIGEILTVSHEAVFQAFKVGNVSVEQNIRILVNNMTTADVKAVIDRLQSIEVTKPTQAQRDQLYPDVVVKQALKNVEEEKLDEKTDDALNNAINKQAIHRDPVAEFGKVFVSPNEWKAWGFGSDERASRQQFIRKKLIELRRGSVLTVNNQIAPNLGLQFSKGHFLNLNTLQFAVRADVPENEQGPPTFPKKKAPPRRRAPAIPPPPIATIPGFQ